MSKGGARMQHKIFSAFDFEVNFHEDVDFQKTSITYQSRNSHNLTADKSLGCLDCLKMVFNVSFEF